MAEYLGPVPPRPANGSTDAQAWDLWFKHDQAANWWLGAQEREAARLLAAAQKVEDEARRAVLDEQHRQKMAAEAACALANTQLAAANLAMASALAARNQIDGKPEAGWTDEQIVRQLMFNMADTVPSGTDALGRARRYVFALRAVYPPTPTPAPSP